MFEFLENYRDVAIPSVEMEDVVLTCRLDPGIADNDIPSQVPGQLREFWLRTAGGLLLVDERFGICGLTLHDPDGAKQTARDRASYGYEIFESDYVVGEFIGDTDMLIIDAQGKVVISTGSYPRDDWYTFDSLADVLRRYVGAEAEKYWELTGK
ncbi:hypothetical protein [Mycobacteroides chelonae]